MAVTLGDMARAKRMMQIAREAGVRQKSLYRALSAGGNPEFAAVLKAVRAPGCSDMAKPHAERGISRHQNPWRSGNS